MSSSWCLTWTGKALTLLFIAMYGNIKKHKMCLFQACKFIIFLSKVWNIFGNLLQNSFKVEKHWFFFSLYNLPAGQGRISGWIQPDRGKTANTQYSNDSNNYISVQTLEHVQQNDFAKTTRRSVCKCLNQYLNVSQSIPIYLG